MIMRVYCLQESKDWDKGIPLLLLESIQESIRFSPFELVFGHVPHGPLKLFKESWLADDAPESLV